MEQLFAGLAPAFKRPKDFARARQLWLAGLLNLGRHTITGSLTTSGQQHHDWSAAYRALQRLPTPQVLSYLQQQTLARTTGPWVIAMDDSCTRKTGRRIPGCAWRRDPLSPPFHVNFIWGQRVLQFSAALPTGDRAARLVPVDWTELPSPQKPGSRATPEQTQAYLEAKRQSNVNVVAVERLKQLRQATDRDLHVVGDGRFTNRTVLRQLPEKTVLIGRIRRDTQLYAACSALQRNGRPRRYGTALPTPESLRTDDTFPWQRVKVRAADQEHELRVKVMRPVMARITGVAQQVQVVVIAPVGYRLRQGGKVLYRKPAYLICTAPDLDLATVVQEYIWRWDIEVNFRDEKTLLGVSEAQLRQPDAVQHQPTNAVAAYAMLLLAAYDCYPDRTLPQTVPLPRWRQHAPPRRATTALLINQLRAELWATSIRRESLSHFTASNPPSPKPDKPLTDLASALFHCHN